MELILLACCKGKQPGGTISYGGSALDSLLSVESHERLLQARRELASLKGLPPGSDLGGPETSESVRYLPAYLRYTGRVYTGGRVQDLYPRAQGKRILIVSALYGLIDADDPIRYYDLYMDQSITTGRKLKAWWKHHDLGRIVEECILALKPERVHDLLSQHYRDALAPWPPRKLEEVGIAYPKYSYSKQGSGSQSRRAEQIKALLSGDEGR